MSVLMDHHDFKSAKRALITGSIALFVFADLTFLSNEIEILKLKFRVSQDKIVFFGVCAVAYMTYIFILRSLELFPVNYRNPSETIVAPLQRSLDELSSFRNEKWQFSGTIGSLVTEIQQLGDGDSLNPMNNLYDASLSYGGDNDLHRKIIEKLDRQIAFSLMIQKLSFATIDILPPLVISAIALAKGSGFEILSF